MMPRMELITVRWEKTAAQRKYKIEAYIGCRMYAYGPVVTNPP
jgi:hypothetical protein